MFPHTWFNFKNDDEKHWIVKLGARESNLIPFTVDSILMGRPLRRNSIDRLRGQRLKFLTLTRTSDSLLIRPH